MALVASSVWLSTRFPSESAQTQSQIQKTGKNIDECAESLQTLVRNVGLPLEQSSRLGHSVVLMGACPERYSGSICGTSDELFAKDTVDVAASRCELVLGASTAQDGSNSVVTFAA